MTNTILAVLGVFFLACTWMGVTVEVATNGGPSIMPWLPWWIFSAGSLCPTIVWSIMLWRGRK